MDLLLSESCRCQRQPSSAHPQQLILTLDSVADTISHRVTIRTLIAVKSIHCDRPVAEGNAVAPNVSDAAACCKAGVPVAPTTADSPDESSRPESQLLRQILHGIRLIIVDAQLSLGEILRDLLQRCQLRLAISLIEIGNLLTNVLLLQQSWFTV